MDYIKRITVVAIAGAALAFAVPLFVPSSADAGTGPTRADSTYCKVLQAWDRAGIPSAGLTVAVAKTALKSEGKYRVTGTALVTAIVAGDSFRPEALSAVRQCRIS